MLLNLQIYLFMICAYDYMFCSMVFFIDQLKAIQFYHGVTNFYNLVELLAKMLNIWACIIDKYLTYGNSLTYFNS